MRRLPLLAACLALGALARAATPVYVSPDVPTDETATPSTVLPWTVSRYDPAVPAYAPAFTVPGKPVIDAVHRRDGAGDWLFSFSEATDLAGALPALADPRDVVAYDGATASWSVLFCGQGVGIPPYADVDALYQDFDGGPLILSFDVPTTLGGNTYDPSDLVRFERTAAGCAGWTPGAAPVFDASAAGTGVPLSANVHGADALTGSIVLAFDVPVDLGPPGPATYLPGQLVSWDGAAWSLYQPLGGWPITGGVDGLALPGNPGRVPPTLQLDKAVGTDLTLSWGASCSQDAPDYGIYEGTIGTWYGHTSIRCTDAGSDRVETVTPSPGNTYYLVVPRDASEEGSYGSGASGERPRGTAVCVPAQNASPCPP